MMRRNTKSSNAPVFKPCDRDVCRNGWLSVWKYDTTWDVNIERYIKCQCRLDYESGGNKS